MGKNHKHIVTYTGCDGKRVFGIFQGATCLNIFLRRKHARKFAKR